MGLELNHLFLGQDAVHRLASDVAIDVGEQHARVQRRIARCLIARIAQGRCAKARDVLAVQLRRADAAVVAGLLRVRHLEQHADVALALGEFLGDVALDGIGIADVVGGMFDAMAHIGITAEVVVGRVVEATAEAEVQLGPVVVDALFKLDETAFVAARKADVVQHGADRLRGQRRCGAATDGFNALVGHHRVSPVVVVAELDIAEQHDRQAVFLDLYEGRTAGRCAKAANADVRVTAIALCTGDLNARDQAVQLGGRGCVKILDVGCGDRADRRRGVELGARTVRCGHNDRGQSVVRGRCGGGRCCFSKGRRGESRGQTHGRQRNICSKSGFAHSVSPCSP